MDTLTSGAFLVAFALLMGASNTVVGLLAAVSPAHAAASDPGDLPCRPDPVAQGTRRAQLVLEPGFMACHRNNPVACAERAKSDRPAYMPFPLFRAGDHFRVWV